jgi:acetoin utilization protein AcuB
MTIRTLIARHIPPLRLDDTVEHALGLLLDHSIYHVPVVDEAGVLVGFISEDQLLNSSGPDAVIESLIERRANGKGLVQVLPDAHVFDATKILVKHGLTAVPVVESDNTYAGLLRRHDIFEQFARMLSTQESGAILAIELEPRDYSLSQLVYTIENNDVKILSIASEPPDVDSGLIRVTVKLNTTDAARVRHMLEHHGYHVVASFSEEETDEDLQWRVQEFMRYLEV